MKIGKREQLVGIGIAGLVTIGSLHFFVFSPRAAALKTAFDAAEKLKPQIEGLKAIANQAQFNQFKAMTEDLRTQYDEVVTTLSLTEGGPFTVKGNVDDVVLDPPPKEGSTPEEIKYLKQKFLIDNFLATSNQQIDLLLAKIRELRAFLRPGEGGEAPKTQFLFLADANGWRFTDQLPPTIYSPGSRAVGPLVDVLSDVAQTYGLLKVIPTEQAELYGRQRAAYEQGLLQLGIDNSLYRDKTPSSLAAMGEYVPLIHKLNHALLLEEALAEDPEREIAGDTFSRDRLLEWLEIKVPVRPIPSTMLGELYYVYNELDFVLNLMRRLSKNEIAQVFGIRIGEISYLVAQPTMGKGSEAADAQRPAPNVILNPSILGGLTLAKREINPQTDTDVGVCFPVTIQLRASNLNLWRFLHDYLGSHPLAEVDEIDIMGTPEGTGDVFCQVRLLHVLRLFQIFKRGGSAAAPAAAPAPPPAAPAQPAEAAAPAQPAEAAAAPPPPPAAAPAAPPATTTGEPPPGQD